jgi:M6 family metalloprotease-like protein
MRSNKWFLIAVLALAMGLLAAQCSSSPTPTPDFTKPYGPVKPVKGERPLLVILLEPDDTQSREQVNVYALKEDGYIRQTIVGVKGSGELDGRYWKIELPETRRFKSAPGVLDSPDGNLQSVFALSEDGYIYQCYHSRISNVADWQNWSAWSALPKTRKFKSAPTAMNSPDGKLASVFALGEDGYIYQAVYSRSAGGGWGQWSRVPGAQRFKSAPAAMNSPDGKLASVFALGEDDYVYQIVYSRSPGGGWEKWSRVPGTQRFQSAPAVMNSPDGKLASVFALGQDKYVYQIVYSRSPGGGWGKWSRVSGTQRFQSAPAVMNSPDGDAAQVYALGEDGYVYQIVYARGADGGWGQWSKLPTPEWFKSAPAVLPRLAHKKSREYIEEMVFGAQNSVRDYFLENSYGQFTFKEAFTTHWLTAQDDPSTTDWDESSHKYLHTSDVHEKGAWVIKQVEKMTSFRFEKYDTSPKDGKVTSDELAILWVYAGGGDARGRGTNPSVVPVPSLSQGVEIGLLMRGGAGMSVATIAHELGHNPLHLTDMYTDGVYPGVARYSLMGKQGKGSHLDAWSKVKLGWLKPTVVTQDGWYTLSDVERHPQAYILYDPDHGTQEYFIVENRWPSSSYEKDLGDQGLAIWRIDESYDYKGGNWGRIAIHLVRAGGPPPVSAANALWDGSDPQTGYDLTPTSSPSNSQWRDGSSSEIAVWCIPKSGPEVRVFFDIPPLRDVSPCVEWKIPTIIPTVPIQ